MSFLVILGPEQRIFLQTRRKPAGREHQVPEHINGKPSGAGFYPSFAGMNQLRSPESPVYFPDSDQWSCIWSKTKGDFSMSASFRGNTYAWFYIFWELLLPCNDLHIWCPPAIRFHRQVCEKNTIVNMDTGLGKTLIAVMSHLALTNHGSWCRETLGWQSSRFVAVYWLLEMVGHHTQMNNSSVSCKVPTVRF